ncbi:MAG: histidine utilization repressor [Deltaproteobacteria bacterium]|nr:MAG: histidine utilization repressor [Deltaproteobacteria bacterium]
MKKNPLYLKIKEHIVKKIDSGEWQVHHKIPSENQLGRLFQTSRMTANKALRDLAQEGFIVRRQGQGSFVAPRRVQSALLEITPIDKEIRQGGGKYSCEVHLLCEEKAAPDIAKALRLTPYQAIYHSIIIHKKDGIPIQLADRYINPKIAAGYLEQDFTQITPTDFLLQVASVSKVEHIVEANIPPAWIRELLSINDAEPCLALSRKTWSHGEIATQSYFYYPGSRYKLLGTFTTSKQNGVIRVA